MSALYSHDTTMPSQNNYAIFLEIEIESLINKQKNQKIENSAFWEINFLENNFFHKFIHF